MQKAQQSTSNLLKEGMMMEAIARFTSLSIEQLQQQLQQLLQQLQLEESQGKQAKSLLP
jgi:hypothetical protein